MRKKTKEDYKNITKGRSIVWDDVEIPKNTNTETWWKCNVCGYRWKAKYVKIRRKGRGCRRCNNRILKTKENYHNIVKNRDIAWIGEELPRTTKIETSWLCLKCGHIWESKYNNIQQKKGCPACADNIPKTEKDYHELAKSRGFKWVGDVLPKGNKEPTWWECEHGDRWEAHYNSIHNGTGCPFCSNRVSKTEKDYHELAEYRGLKWLGPFPQTTHRKTWWECDGHKLKISYNNVQAGWGYSKYNDMVNGSLVSNPQRKLNNLLCGSLNYPEGKYRIDVAIMRNSQKIAVEYDCCYWHEGNEEHDEKRDKFLISKGWKVLHIKSRNLIPTKKQTKQAIKQLTNNNIINIFLDDWK